GEEGTGGSARASTGHAREGREADRGHAEEGRVDPRHRRAIERGRRADRARRAAVVREHGAEGARVAGGPLTRGGYGLSRTSAERATCAGSRDQGAPVDRPSRRRG